MTPAAIPRAAIAVQAPGLHYTIDVTLDPERHRLDGTATIVYRSGADTALTALFLHAYPNAFSGPHTLYAREAASQGENWELRFAKPRDLGWMTLDSARVDGVPARIEMDETIATLRLPHPLQPGDSLRAAMRFRVQIPRHFDRLGRTGDAYSISQWYPKLVVYDDEGWHPDPFHYMSEFYGDYGTFDVTVHVPDDYWVGTTGVLARVTGGDNEIPLQDRDVPRDSVTVTFRAVTADSLAGKWPHRELRAKTDLARGEGDGAIVTIPRGGSARLRVPRGAPVHYAYAWENRADSRDEADPSGRSRPLHLVIAAADTSLTDTLRALAADEAAGDTLLSSMKSLRIHAERVHDFAWVASPDYVRSDTTWDGVRIRSLSFRGDQDKWADSKRYVADAMRHHTDTVGPYVYPQFTTAEGWCGGGAMEYPMLIMNEPEIADGPILSLDDTIAHELGHNWFYGMLGSDERAHPWLDEGFSQWIQDEYTDRKYPQGLFRWARRLPWLSPRGAFTSDEIAYLSRMWAGDERPVSTPANGYPGYRPYAVAAYAKPVAMLRALRGLIGRPAFDRFLHRYYRENRFRHPRPEDVYRAAEEEARSAGISGLDRFFREWVETIHRPDFALRSIGAKRTEAGWLNTVVVRRAGELVMPVTVEGRFADGTRNRIRVETPQEINRGTFPGKSRLVSAVLDPDHDLVERNRLDNRLGIPPMRWRPLFDFPQTEEIAVLYGPTLWHGNREGLRLGGWLEGRYLPMRDFPRGVLGFEAGWNAGTRHGETAWRLGGWKHAGLLGARGELRLLGVRDEGLNRFEVTARNRTTAPGIRHPFRSWWAGVQVRDRFDLRSVDERYWSPGTTLNVSAGVRIETIGPRREDRLELELRRGASAFGGGSPKSQAGYDWARLEAERRIRLGSGAYEVTVRGYAGSAWRRVPLELRFDVGEGSRLDALARFYENDRGPLRATGHYLTEGGGGLRGYADRAVLGQRIAALNLDLTQSRTGIFAFGDVGGAESPGLGEASPIGSDPLLGHTLADAGVGYVYGPLTATLPLWVGRPPAGEAPFKVRWMVRVDLAGLHPWW